MGSVKFQHLFPWKGPTLHHTNTLHEPLPSEKVKTVLVISSWLHVTLVDSLAKNVGVLQKLCSYNGNWLKGLPDTPNRFGAQPEACLFHKYFISLLICTPHSKLGNALWIQPFIWILIQWLRIYYIYLVLNRMHRTKKMYRTFNFSFNLNGINLVY